MNYRESGSGLWHVGHSSSPDAVDIDLLSDPSEKYTVSMYTEIGVPQEGQLIITFSVDEEMTVFDLILPPPAICPS